jgi:hypothetical protein
MFAPVGCTGRGLLFSRRPHVVLFGVQTARSTTQWGSNAVSARSLPKTGIFQTSAGDYRRFRPKIVQIGRLETELIFAKTRNCRAFIGFSMEQSPVAGLAGWGGRIRTSTWRIGSRMLSPVREEPQNLFLLKFISSSKRSNFENRTKSTGSRASERNGPFGE